MAGRRTLAILVALAVLALSVAAPAATPGPTPDHFGGRELYVYVPAHMPPAGARALVIVLHGGLGNAERIVDRRSESGLNLDAVAEQDGFVVAYLNGTPVTRFGDEMLGWNAGGGCCGMSATNEIDDVGYIRGAVRYLAGKYGVDPARVFGIGHSNGAMMAQRMVCDTDVFAAVVAISGPLNLHADACPDARGRRVLAIHGADDANVPVVGGRGSKGISGVAYVSEQESEQVFQASGGAYTLDLVPGADHQLDHIEAQVEKIDGMSLGQKAAGFFGLAGG
jgi:polyhydroxybutyrate depolymerase